MRAVCVCLSVCGALAYLTALEKGGKHLFEHEPLPSRELAMDVLQKGKRGHNEGLHIRPRHKSLLVDGWWRRLEAVEAAEVVEACIFSVVWVRVVEERVYVRVCRARAGQSVCVSALGCVAAWLRGCVSCTGY